MTSEFDKEYLPIWCEDCDRQGYIFVEDPDSSYFVTCKTCSWETSQVWCPKCQMGGEFVRNINKRPSAWNCPNCQTKYSLPAGFYENSINLFTEEALPTIVRERIVKDFKSAQSISGRKRWRNLLVMIILLVVLFLPVALIFTSLRETLVGTFAILLLFFGWIFLFEKLVKNFSSKLFKW